MNHGGELSRCLLCASPGAPGTSCPTCLVARPPLGDSPAAGACPRCKVALEPIVLGDGAAILACTSCRWTLLPTRVWSRVFDDLAISAEIEARVPLPTIRVEDLLPLLGCPACGREMERARFAATSPFVIDVCRWAHGVWVDAGAIAKIVAHATHGAPPPADRPAAPAPQLPHVDVAIPLPARTSATSRAPGLGTLSIVFFAGLLLIFAGLRLVGPSCRGKSGGGDDLVPVPVPAPRGGR